MSNQILRRKSLVSGIVATVGQYVSFKNAHAADVELKTTSSVLRIFGLSDGLPHFYIQKFLSAPASIVACACPEAHIERNAAIEVT